MKEVGTTPRDGRSPEERRVEGPEMWAGLECTLNRVGDRYHDQLARAGHYARPDDVDRIADLGVRAIRYPVLWERHLQGGDAAWAITDWAMERMRARGVEPIVGLVHHGSGPPDTNIADPRFAEGLERFAREVAQRYPWVRRYTPINEPLTTARFALLYRLWYPHKRSDVEFMRAMFVQTMATRRAMAAIRSVREDAELVQTEDLGHTHTTPQLRYQGDFENARRWLTFDLLLGRVDRAHPMWRHLCRVPNGREMLAQFADAPCAPAILGLNHYITSERFLDHRIERYPVHTHGGNRRHVYADVEAIRAVQDGVHGPRRLLREAWERYGIPLAVTEAHLGCSREQQLCWLGDLVQAAHLLSQEGVDFRAVTAWAALGSFDWPSLLTQDQGIYESGLFDVRGPAPRPTALATMVRALAAEGAYDHPVLDSPGWWHCDRRLIFDREPEHECGRPRPLPLVRAAAELPPPSSIPPYPVLRSPLPHGSARGDVRRILVLGSAGTLGRAFERICAERQLAAVCLMRRDLDVTDARRVAEVLDELRPWAVINAAGFVRVDDAEKERERCRWTNTIGPAVLADRCVTRDVPFLTFSTDLVFDGTKGTEYVESDRVSPLNTYGRSKAEAERLVREIMPEAIIVRTSAFFGEWDDHNFLSRTLAALASGRRVRVAEDMTISPTFVPDLVNVALDLLIDGESGLWHLANRGAVSWAEFARMGATMAGLPAERLIPCPGEALALAAPRPVHSALRSERGELLGSLEQAVARYVSTRPWERLTRRATRPRDASSPTPEGVESLVAAPPGAE